MCDINDKAEHHIVSPVSKKTGSSQEIDFGNAVTPSITTCCCLGLIRTKKADKEQTILILKQDQLYFWTLVFQKNTDQKVTICCVNGDDRVTSVSVTRPHSGINLGVGMTTYLLEGNILGIQSIQRVYEYKVVCVDDEILELNKERSSPTKVDNKNGQFKVEEVASFILSNYNGEQIIRNTTREDNNNDSNGNDDDNNIHNCYHYNNNDRLYLDNYLSIHGYNGNKTVDDTIVVEKNSSSDSSSNDNSSSKSNIEPRAASQKPEDCMTVFVGNLSWYVDKDTFCDAFKDCSTITQVFFSIDRETGDFNGYGHIEFGETEAIDKALKLEGTDILGRAV